MSALTAAAARRAGTAIVQAWEAEAGDHALIPGLTEAFLLVEAVGRRELDGYSYVELTVWAGDRMMALTLDEDQVVEVTVR